jgi:hypothetical protein
VSEGYGNDLPQPQCKYEVASGKIVSVIEGAKKETETIRPEERCNGFKALAALPGR